MRNTGDRPIQVGSHFHFFEVNRALEFDRAKAFGMRLDIPATTGIRFEPGESKRSTWCPWAASSASTGSTTWSTTGSAAGRLPPVKIQSLEKAEKLGFKSKGSEKEKLESR